MSADVEWLAEAERWRANGATVVPLLTDGSKRPACKWRAFQDELIGPDRIPVIFARTTDGIAVVCGAGSGQLEMLELEARAMLLVPELDARMTAAGLGAVWDRIKTGYAQRSPSGGAHWYLRTDGPARPNTKLACTVDNEVRIETRGQGGFAVVAPSGGKTHKTGRPWVVVAGDPSTIPVITTAERDGIYEVCRSFDEAPPSRIADGERPSVVEPSGRPGDDFNARVSWSDVIGRHGWTAIRRLNGETYWRKPGSTDTEHHATTGQDEHDRLYVFSTATLFDAERPYSKFAAYALLDHGGDFAAAAAELRRRGYGDASEPGLIFNGETTMSTTTSAATLNGDRPPTVRTPGAPQTDGALFRGVLGGIAHELAETTEAAPVAIYTTLLAAAGAFAGPGPHTFAGATRHPLLIWPLVWGSTGEGRKGESWSAACQAFPDALDAVAGPIESGLSSGEGLIERLRDPRVTTKASEYAGTDDKRLLIFEPEFATTMVRAKREGSSLAGVLRQAWDGGRLSVLTKQQLVASGSHVAIVAHITPTEFKRRMVEAELAGGTYNRFLPLFVTRTGVKPDPPRLDPQHAHALRRKFSDTVRTAMQVGEVWRDREVSDQWRSLYEEFSSAAQGDEKWAVFSVRAAPYCLRIAALHAALDGRAIMSGDDLEAAAALVRFSLASVRYVLGAMYSDARTEKIAMHVRSRAPEWVARSEIGKVVLGNHASSAVLDMLLAELIAVGGFEQQRASTAGRDATMYRWISG